LLTLIMSAAGARTTLATNCIDLIDEDNARTIFFSLLEQVTYAGCAHADEHFNEVRTRDGVERNASFASHRASEQGLTRTKKSLISCSSSTASSAPATSSKVLVGMSLVSSLALEPPMPNMPPAPDCMREMNQNSTANKINIGSKKENIDMKIESCVTLVW